MDPWFGPKKSRAKTTQLASGAAVAVHSFHPPLCILALRAAPVCQSAPKTHKFRVGKVPLTAKSCLVLVGVGVASITTCVQRPARAVERSGAAAFCVGPSDCPIPSALLSPAPSPSPPPTPLFPRAHRFPCAVDASIATSSAVLHNMSWVHCGTQLWWRERFVAGTHAVPR